MSVVLIGIGYQLDACERKEESRRVLIDDPYKIIMLRVGAKFSVGCAIQRIALYPVPTFTRC